jgi:hypothetical protein
MKFDVKITGENFIADYFGLEEDRVLIIVKGYLDSCEKIKITKLK